MTQILTGSPMLEVPWTGFVRAAAQYVLQVAVEHELTAFLGRARYGRGERSQAGLRNGYHPRRLETEAGRLSVAVPEVRGTTAPFRSQVLTGLGAHSPELVALVTQMYVRGCSTRDIEATLTETCGGRVLSRSEVSRLTRQLTGEFEAWRTRSLEALDVVYLFLDGIALPVRQGTSVKESVLCASAILADGRRALIHLALGGRESGDAWLGFLHDLTSRGLHAPLLIITDGNPGLRKALRQVWSGVPRQRCLVHKLRNILAKLPKAMIPTLKPLVQQVFHAATAEQGRRRAQALRRRFGDRYEAAMQCLLDDLDECLSYLPFPAAHHRRIRTTNPLERLFGEVRRRTKVIPRFPTESSCLRLVFATLMTAAKTWHGVRMTPAIVRQLQQIAHDQHHDQTAPAALPVAA